MRNSYFIYTALIIFSLSQYVIATPFNDDPPNIVVIMADDVGLGDISYHVRNFMEKDPAFETPYIDRLAENGMWFTDGHSATSLCSPTRYCVMSGNNNYRSKAPWGVWNTFNKSPFREGEVTLGSVVQAAGYKTGFIGKWHLGGDFKSADGTVIFRGSGKAIRPDQVNLKEIYGGDPLDLGFDYSFMLPCGIQGPIYTAYQQKKWYPLNKKSKLVFLNEENAINPKDITSKGPGAGDSHWDARNIGKLISAKAVKFIDECAGKAPFFLYYCSPMPHLPHCPPDFFDGRQVSGSTPSPHLDCVVDLDCQVARIIKALEKNNILNNTLIIFMSDNGGLVNIDPQDKGLGYNSSGGWAGAKNSPLEGGHRTPFIVTWPSKIKKKTTSDQLVVNTDLLATLAAIVGTHVPENEALDSKNLLPILLDQQKGDFRRSILLQAGSNCEVIYRKDPWKLIIQSDWKCSYWEPIKLFNLDESPNERASDNQILNPNLKDLVDRLSNEYITIRSTGVSTVLNQ